MPLNAESGVRVRNVVLSIMMQRGLPIRVQCFAMPPRRPVELVKFVASELDKISPATSCFTLLVVKTVD